MRPTQQILGAAAAAGFALTLASCASAENAVPESGSGGSAAAGGPVTVGIKFDQPGLGQQVGSDFKGFDVEVMEESEGDVAGIKSATIKVTAEYAYGTLCT